MRRSQRPRPKRYPSPDAGGQDLRLIPLAAAAAVLALVASATRSRWTPAGVVGTLGTATVAHGAVVPRQGNDLHVLVGPDGRSVYAQIGIAQPGPEQARAAEPAC